MARATSAILALYLAMKASGFRGKVIEQSSYSNLELTTRLTNTCISVLEFSMHCKPLNDLLFCILHLFSHDGLLCWLIELIWIVAQLMVYTDKMNAFCYWYWNVFLLPLTAFNAKCCESFDIVFWSDFFIDQLQEQWWWWAARMDFNFPLTPRFCGL